MTPSLPDARERELFEAWWFDPTSADNTKKYAISPSDVDEVRRLCEDIACKAFKAGRASAAPVVSQQLTTAAPAVGVPAVKPDPEDWLSQEFTAPVFPPDGTVSPYTVVNMGHGLVEVGEARHEGRPAVFFGRMEAAKPLGETVTTEPRTAKVGETIAIITFANAGGLDVLANALTEIRAACFPDASPPPSPAAGG